MPRSETVLLFDAMDTLVVDPFYTEVPAFFRTSLEELLAVKHPDAWVEYELGRIDEGTFLARFFEDGREYDRRGLVRHVEEAYRWVPGMEDLLRELCRTPARMHVLSNYSDWYRRIEARLGVSRYLPWTFVSCDTGVRKPDPESFLGPARALGVAPEACLLVDDREGNCRAARAVGLDAILFTGAARLGEELRARGLLT